MNEKPTVILVPVPSDSFSFVRLLKNVVVSQRSTYGSMRVALEAFHEKELRPLGSDGRWTYSDINNCSKSLWNSCAFLSTRKIALRSFLLFIWLCQRMGTSTERQAELLIRGGKQRRKKGLRTGLFFETLRHKGAEVELRCCDRVA